MSAEVVVALISAGVAVCSAGVSAYATARSIRLQHALASPAPGQLDRLITVQQALADVIEFLGPDGLRFPREHLARLPGPGPGPRTGGPAGPAASAERPRGSITDHPR